MSKDDEHDKIQYKHIHLVDLDERENTIRHEECERIGGRWFTDEYAFYVIK